MTALLALGVLCCRRAPGDDSARDSDSDTGDTAQTPGIPGCHGPTSDPPSELPALFSGGEGLDYRVVDLEGGDIDPLYALVGFSSDGETAYDAGAPVVVTSQPSLDVSSEFRAAPTFEFERADGVVEVLPVYPGWEVQGFTTAGLPDSGGPRDEAALLAAVRFAAGLAPSADGFTLAQLVAQPVCDAEVLLLATSSGGTDGLGLLRDHVDELAPHLAGFAAYELPMVPQFLLTDPGAVWMDPDDGVDADGDGFGWDDARSPSFDADSCTPLGCGEDLSDLAWTEEYRVSDLWLGRPDPAQLPGVFFLDRDHDGALGVDAEGGTDLNGDGLVSATEDGLLLPHVMIDLDETGEEVHVYSDDIVAAAESVALVSPWPAFVLNSLGTSTFWADRSPGAAVASASAAWTSTREMRAAVIYGYSPHAVPWPSAPEVRMLFGELQAGGADVRYNAGLEVARCVLPAEELGDWAGGPEPGFDPGADAIMDYAVPDSVSHPHAIAVGALGVIWDRWGPFDRCAGG